MDSNLLALDLDNPLATYASGKRLLEELHARDDDERLIYTELPSGSVLKDILSIFHHYSHFRTDVPELHFHGEHTYGYLKSLLSDLPHGLVEGWIGGLDIEDCYDRIPEPVVEATVAIEATGPLKPESPEERDMRRLKIWITKAAVIGFGFSMFTLLGGIIYAAQKNGLVAGGPLLKYFMHTSIEVAKIIFNAKG